MNSFGCVQHLLIFELQIAVVKIISKNTVRAYFVNLFKIALSSAFSTVPLTLSCTTFALATHFSSDALTADYKCTCAELTSHFCFFEN